MYHVKVTRFSSFK